MLGQKRQRERRLLTWTQKEPLRRNCEVGGCQQRIRAPGALLSILRTYSRSETTRTRTNWLHTQVEALAHVSRILEMNLALLRKAEAHRPEVDHLGGARVGLDAVRVRAQFDERRDRLAGDFQSQGHCPAEDVEVRGLARAPERPRRDRDPEPNRGCLAECTPGL